MIVNIDMKAIRNILSLTLGLGAVASLVTPALAIPYNGATVYKAMDGTTQIVVFSGTPGSRISVNLGSSPRPVARLAGSCGEVRISPPASGNYTGLEVDGTAINAATLPTQTLPSCVNGNFSEARSANFKTPNNQIVIVNKTPGAAVAVSLPSAVSRGVTINGCGFGILRASSGQTLPATFSTESNSYTLASLPNSNIAPYCRNINGTPYGYVPASW